MSSGTENSAEPPRPSAKPVSARKLDLFTLGLRHLWAFLAVVERGSASSAAKKVGMSQPALTRMIGNLEEALGAVLFVRQPGGMCPTAAGKAAAERFQRAMSFISQAAREMGGSGGRGFERRGLMMKGTQLRSLVSLSDGGNLTDASEAIGLSRRTLHRNIRDLERLWGVPLVDHRGALIALSQAGEVLARGTRIAAAEIEAAVVDCGEDGSAGDGRIVVGATSMIRLELLPDAILRLLRVAPAAKVDVVEGSSPRLLRLLRDGLIDCMLGVLRDDDPDDVEQTAIMQGPGYCEIGVFGRRGHPLSKVRNPSLDDFRRYPWVMNRTPWNMGWDEYFPGIDSDKLLVQCDSVTTIRGIIRSSDFLTILSPAQLKIELEWGSLQNIGAPIGEGGTIGIGTRQDWRPNATQREFLKILKAVGYEYTHELGKDRRGGAGLATGS